MRVPQLVATDLDGTLLRPDGTVSARTAAALVAAAEVGIEVVFVTARPPRWLADVAAHVAGHGVAICANGAAVVDIATGAALEQHGMGPDLVRDLAGRARSAVQGAQLAAESIAGFALETGYRSAPPVPPQARVADRIEDVLTASTLKLLVRTDPPVPDLPAALADAFGDLASVLDSGSPGLGEISRPDVSKAGTLASWAAARGIAAEDVWAFGDAPNDLSMLRWAGTGFAVRNAHPLVREVADEVCGSNADDGVAQVLERAVALAR